MLMEFLLITYAAFVVMAAAFCTFGYADIRKGIYNSAMKRCAPQAPVAWQVETSAILSCLIMVLIPLLNLWFVVHVVAAALIHHKKQ